MYSLVAEARCVQHVARRRLHLRELRLYLGTIQLIGPADPRSREVVADIRKEQAEGRGQAGIRWHDDLGNAHLNGEFGTVKRSRPPECDQRELPRIVAPLGGHLTHGLDHVGVGDRDDTICSLGDIHAETVGDPFHGLPREVRPEFHGAAGQPLRTERAEDHIGVGVRRFRAARTVTGRAGRRARARRPALQHTTLVDPGDGAATGADRDEIDRRKDHGDAEIYLRLLGRADLSLEDRRDVRTRAAHVETDDVADAGEFAQGLGGDDTGGRARHDRACSVAPGALRRGHAARGLHDKNLASIALVMEALAELIHVAPDDRLQIGVDYRRRRTLELEDHRDQLG